MLSKLPHPTPSHFYYHNCTLLASTTHFFIPHPKNSSIDPATKEGNGPVEGFESHLISYFANPMAFLKEYQCNEGKYHLTTPNYGISEWKYEQFWVN
jgi:hypothetical protein